MELYEEILANVQKDLAIAAAKYVEMKCYRALTSIQAILADDSLSDIQCFDRIEAIVRMLEGLGSGGGERHDFQTHPIANGVKEKALTPRGKVGIIHRYAGKGAVAVAVQKDLRLGLLLDYYRPLLTAHQQTLLEEYYGLDLSLAEIAGRYGVSRQAVRDVLHRGGEQLLDLEKKLGLAREDAQRSARLAQVLACVRAVRQGQAPLEALDAACGGLDELLQPENP